MQPSCTNSLCTMPWPSKNTISIVFTHDFWKSSFFGRGECSPTHSGLWRFVSGSYAKQQLSSPVLTLSKKFLSPLITFNRSWHAATSSSICSRVSACGTNLEHGFSSSNLFLKSVEPQFSGCRVYLLLAETSLFDLLWPFCRWQRCCHHFDLWVDHGVCHHSLNLCPLKTVCATQKLLFDLMLHHHKPSESVSQSL